MAPTTSPSTVTSASVTRWTTARMRPRSRIACTSPAHRRPPGASADHPIGPANIGCFAGGRGLVTFPCRGLLGGSQTMGYSLGIDLGATTCVAAIRRGATLEVPPLGDHATGMPAVALPRDDGTAAVGEWADARSIYEPPLVARHVLARLGDGRPIDIDGHPVDPVGLTGAVLREAVARAALGRRPARPRRRHLPAAARRRRAGARRRGRGGDRCGARRSCRRRSPRSPATPPRATCATTWWWRWSTWAARAST